MRNFLLGALLVILAVVTYRYFEVQDGERDQLKANTALIQEQIRNVGKLVVTEGTFSQVYSYNDSKKFYLDLLSARKKALIVVNAKASVAYDLSKLQIEVDEENRKVVIRSIPEEEISINPDIKYYDITQDYFNQFTASDYNKIKTRIRTSLEKKVEKSTLKSNAQNRLITELQKIYILTNSLGWTLEYNNQVLEDDRSLEQLKL